MMQPSLFEWVPPVILGDREGETYDRKRDLSRLNDQMRAVFLLMQDGQWRPLFAIAHHTGHPEASVSARLRDLKKSRYGGFQVEKRYIANGVWHYRLVIE